MNHRKFFYAKKWRGDGCQWDQNFSHLVLPLSLLSVVVPIIICLFFCKLVHNVAIFVAIFPAGATLRIPLFVLSSPTSLIFPTPIGLKKAIFLPYVYAQPRCNVLLLVTQLQNQSRQYTTSNGHISKANIPKPFANGCYGGADCVEGAWPNYLTSKLLLQMTSSGFAKIAWSRISLKEGCVFSNEIQSLSIDI